MALSINNNLMALGAARQVRDHARDLETSISRLVTGQRIRTAADDPAGLAVRELMRAEIGSLNQGGANAGRLLNLFV